MSLKTWSATTRKVRSTIDESMNDLFRPALLQGRAAGVGQPFTNIVCRLPISDWMLACYTSGNWQMAIGNQQ